MGKPRARARRAHFSTWSRPAPGIVDGRPMPTSMAPPSWLRERTVVEGPSVEHGPRPMRRGIREPRRLAAVPQPVVERPGRHAPALGEQLAGMDGAGADLTLHAPAGGGRGPCVDAPGGGRPGNRHAPPPPP